MEKKVKRYKSHLRIAIFVLASIISAVSVPTEHVFRYDFRTGEPWAYSDLIASDNFPIKKSENQIKREKDSILYAILPVYRFDSTTSEYVSKALNVAFLKHRKNIRKSLRIKEIGDSLTRFEKEILKVTAEMYKKGIFQTLPDAADVVLVLHDKNASEINVKESYSEKMAYDKLSQVAKRYRSDIYPKLNFDELVKANHIPDNEMSEKIMSEQFADFSEYAGVVQSGERIVAKGEVINDLKYRMLVSFREYSEKQTVTSMPGALHYLGQWIMFLLFYAIFFAALFIFERKAFDSLKQVIFFVIGTLFYVIFASLLARYDSLSPFIIPMLILPVLTVTFYNAQTAILHHTVTLVIVSFILPNSFDFFLIQFISGFALAAGLVHLRRRGQVLRMTFLVFLLQVVVYLALTLVYENSFAKLDYEFLLWAFISSAIIPATYPMVYMFERAFGFISEVSLIELADTNRQLLRDLSEKAPGTFQHSMQVANLAEDAVRKINGNTLLVRTGALYHDIGKMQRPSFFTENQLNGQNIHDTLTPEESAKIIIEHVSYGLELAHKHHIPSQIQEFISTHHADGVVRWFLHAYKEKHQGEVIDESKFRYKGHKPSTKETAVVMMADSIEAASRSLKTYDKKSISDLVDKLIDFHFAERNFSMTDMTFNELKIVRQAFKDKLINVYHSRIEYPE